MDELNRQHQPIPTPGSARKAGIGIVFINAFWILISAIFIEYAYYKWIWPIASLITIFSAILAWKSYPYLFRIRASTALGMSVWILMWACCFVAITYKLPLDQFTKFWISFLAEFGIFLTVITSLRACWLQHKRTEKRRYRGINFKTMEYDYMRDSFSEEPIDFVVLSSSPLYRLMFVIILALSGGPALVVLANKFSEFMYFTVGALATWTLQLIFLAVILPMMVDTYVIYKLEKKHGKPLRIVVPDRKRKPA